MITPDFSTSQTDETVVITLSLPLTKIEELEANTDEKNFFFSCSPYYLRLTFEDPLGEIIHELHENESYQFAIEKLKKRDYLKNPPLVNVPLLAEFEEEGDEDVTLALSKLDLKGNSSTPCEIKITASEDKNMAGENKITSSENKITSSENKITSVKNQNKKSGENKTLSSENNISSSEKGFGFALLGNKNFEKLFPVYQNIFDLNPFHVKVQDRESIRIEIENKKFDGEHYLADFFDNDLIDEMINMKPSWNGWQNYAEFNEDDTLLLNSLKKKNYDLTDTQALTCYYGLLDILFAYCYDRRTTDFEGTVESSWTISKISGTLSAFAVFRSAKDALISSYRRSLAYPLHRAFRLSEKVFQDVKKIIFLGDPIILKCLCDIYHIFQEEDDAFILNELYIRDYINFVEHSDKKKWGDFVEEVCDVVIEKSDLSLDLGQFERQALKDLDLIQGSSEEGSSEEDSSDDGSSDDDSSDSENSSKDEDSSSSDSDTSSSSSTGTSSSSRSEEECKWKRDKRKVINQTVTTTDESFATSDTSTSVTLGKTSNSDVNSSGRNFDTSGMSVDSEESSVINTSEVSSSC